ncbi:MAG: hypothetical protein SNH55_04655 [Rikenellaceae bacterium]
MESLKSSFVNIYGERLTSIEIAFVVLFPLALFQFYGFVDISKIVLRLSLSSAIVLSMIYCCEHIMFRKYRFNTIPYYIKILLLSVVVSIFVALFSRDQGLVASFKANMGTFLGYIYFFVLYKIKPNTQMVVRVVLLYAFLYLVCYIWGMMNAPDVVFGTDDELDDSRGGIFRLRLRGIGFVVLSFFYTIVRAISNRRWYILSVALYALIILSLTRQFILLSLLVALFFLAWRRVWLRTLLGVLTLFVLIGQSSFVKIDNSTPIGNLINRSIDQVNSPRGWEDDIRVKSFKAQISDFHQNTVEVLFGSGYAYGDTSYGRWERRHFIDRGYYRSDVGYAGTYVTLGIIGLLIFVAIFYRAVTIPVVGDVIFAKLFIYYVLLTNVASWPLCTSVSEISIALYLLSIYRTQQRVTLLQQHKGSSNNSLKYLSVTNYPFSIFQKSVVEPLQPTFAKSKMGNY